jgi:hypothetical protein
LERALEGVEDKAQDFERDDAEGRFVVGGTRSESREGAGRMNTAS